MASDTSINRIANDRIANDSNTTVHRRKTNSDSIDVSKISFFDELLSIGQFESRVADSNRLPIDQSTSSGKGFESQSDSSPTDEPSSEQAAYAAQVLAQQPLTPQSQAHSLDEQVISFSDDDENSAKASENSRRADKSIVSKDSKRIEKRSAKGTVQGTGTQKTGDLIQAAADLHTIPVEEEPVDIPNGNQSEQTLDKKKSKQTKDIRASENGSNANANTKQTASDAIESNHAHAVAKPKQSSEILNAAKQQSEDENIGSNPAPTRTKRAERLAKHATESKPVSDEQNPSSETVESHAFSQEAAKSETSSGKGSLSVGSEQNSVSPITSISPMIASSVAFSSGVANTTTSLATRPIVDGIAAVSISSLRGGLQTNDASTTFSSSVPNSARAEQSKAEVARSSAGPHISAYQETKLVQRVLRGVEQLANGGGQVRLRLHPPELGSLQMSLRMEAGQVFAKLEVENTTARDALLNNVQTLKDRMAEQGMNVAAFEVEVSTDSSGSGTGGSNFQSDGGSGSESRWNNASSRYAQQNNNRISSEPETPERKSREIWTRTNGSIDLTV